MIDKVDEIIGLMGLDGVGAEIQRAQTAHRLRLIDFWQIKPGGRVLEIGCGQGDTLAALAYTVGGGGYARGIDIAGEAYGSPETLGQARDRLESGPLGSRIRMDFDTDVLSEVVSFENNEFDYIVLSHCLWYLPDYQTLVRILQRVRPWGKRLCIAEWDANASEKEQLPHQSAAFIQAVCGAYSQDERLNIKTMLYPSQITAALAGSGWLAARTGTVTSADMQDSKWEIAAAREICPDIIEASPAMPGKLKELLFAQLDQLKTAGEVMPLDAFCVLGERAEAEWEQCDE